MHGQASTSRCSLRPPPRLVVDQVGDLQDQKIAGLCAMHTQIAPSLALLGADRFRVLNQEECYVAWTG